MSFRAHGHRRPTACTASPVGTARARPYRPRPNKPGTQTPRLASAASSAATAACPGLTAVMRPMRPCEKMPRTDAHRGRQTGGAERGHGGVVAELLAQGEREVEQEALRRCVRRLVGHRRRRREAAGIDQHEALGAVPTSEDLPRHVHRRLDVDPDDVEEVSRPRPEKEPSESTPATLTRPPIPMSSRGSAANSWFRVAAEPRSAQTVATSTPNVVDTYDARLASGAMSVRIRLHPRRAASTAKARPRPRPRR